jgi:hypothetical protein
MNWPTILAFTKVALEFAGDAAWPIATGFVALQFKEPITSAIDRLRKVAGFGAEAEISPRSAQIGESTGLEASPLPTLGGPLTVSPEPPVDPLLSPAQDRLVQSLQAEALNETQRLAWAARTAVIWQALHWHEKTYRLIYGSQILFLRHLNVVGSMTVMDARAFFDVNKTQGIDAPAYNAADWLRFLVDDERVVLSGATSSTVEISLGGRAFLTWMATNGVSEFRPY